jgi:hypothetical protein
MKKDKKKKRRKYNDEWAINYFWKNIFEKIEFKGDAYIPVIAEKKTSNYIYFEMLIVEICNL